jgi:UDP-N-acetylglucosamine acyltransferase
MTGVHVAHDCKIGNKNILVNQVTLGGHVNIMNSVVIGGLSAIIQFVTIGSHTMIGGMSGIDKNVLPFSLVIGNRAKLRGLNLVGIRRNNFSKSEIERIKEVHQCISSNNFEFDQNIKIDQFFIKYKSLINEKLGHIQE